jgi:hypothetical protein
MFATMSSLAKLAFEFSRKSVTPLEMAEHILQQAASGVRDLNRLKSSAFEKLRIAA